MILNIQQPNQIIEQFLANKIGVLPTDTIYGIHCLALNKDLIERIYQIKNRPAELPVIRLIADPADLSLFNIEPTEFEHEQINKFWPGPNTLIFTNSFGESLSFRQPNNEFLISVLKETGPLISTSANLHKSAPCVDVNACLDAFGENVDFYVDGGILNNPPSSVYKIEGQSVTKLR